MLRLSRTPLCHSVAVGRENFVVPSSICYNCVDIFCILCKFIYFIINFIFSIESHI